MATTGNENPFFGRKIRLQLIEIEREIVQKGMAQHPHIPTRILYMGKSHGQRRKKLQKEMTIKLFSTSNTKHILLSKNRQGVERGDNFALN